MLVSKEFKVGFVFFLALCVFLVFAISLGSLSFGKSAYSYEIAFERISGLSEGDEVKVNGMKVGAVEDMQLIKVGNSRRVLVTITVDRELEFCENYSIIIEDKNMVGGHAISIELGDLDKPLPQQDRLMGVSRSFGEVPRQIDLTEIMHKTSHSLEEMIRILEATRDTESTVGMMMGDKEVAAEIKNMIHNLAETSEKLDSIVEKITDDEGFLNKFLEDREMYDSLGAIVADTEVLTKKLRESRGMLRALDDEKLYRDIAMTVSDLRDTAESIKLLAEEIRRDPQLFLLGRDSGRRSWLIQQLRGRDGPRTEPFVPRDSRKLTPGDEK